MAVRRSAPVLRTLRARVHGLLADLADDWLPRCCLLCERAGEPAPRGLCQGCLDDMPGRLSPRCRHCGLRSDIRQARCRCVAAGVDASAPSRIVVGADYDWPVDRLVLSLKFGGHPAYASPLAALAAEAVRRARDDAGRDLLDGLDAIVPVPPPPARLASRGIDHAGAIAVRVAAELGRPSLRTALRRTREAASQAALGRVARAANLRDAFAADPRRVRGQRVAVVDDVMTTGATFEAVALALRAAGAADVVGIAVARTPAPHADRACDRDRDHDHEHEHDHEHDQDHDRDRA